ncbi:Threonyl-tRNA synthetase [Candidatus Burkholderia verschuerenii]|uniref:Threonyl-tRNA synthetase n=1 Tax=Candidatus Burkholderia verschuerenii TaxID=242163 RepID=A0A0L0MB91_9BURK|nr:Threonyl-tRNA synthetase [Candidatus Burkholderia verschuerenii]
MATMTTPREIIVRLRDGDGGRQHVFEGPATVGEALTMLDPARAKDAVGARLDGQLVDLTGVVLHDGTIDPVMSDDPDGLSIVRRACAQLLGHAVKQLYPSAQMAIARVTDDGFDYDIAYEQPFTPDDLLAIEARMCVLADTEYDILKYALPHEEVLRIFRMNRTEYKLRLLDAIPKDSSVSIYIHQDYIDMSRGPDGAEHTLSASVQIDGCFWCLLSKRGAQ